MLYILLPALCCVLLSCRDEPTPKPKGYYRIALPEKAYKVFRSDCGFSMEVPEYSTLQLRTDKGGDSCWFNLEVPRHKATIHFTHHSINDNLDRFMEDAYALAYKHDIKASSINKAPVRIDSTKVYGLMYDLKGNAATNLRFYLTDSTHHFLAGALYFKHYPNMDSINPVLQWLRQDVIHLTETLRWE